MGFLLRTCDQCPCAVGSRAQVVINEFSCSNYSLNIAGNNEDFVELYNETGDGLTSAVGTCPTTWTVCDPGRDRRPAERVSDDHLQLDLYARRFLNTNCKPCPMDGHHGRYTYGTDISPNQEDHSWARDVDGTGDCTAPTPNATNAGSAASYGYAMPMARSARVGGPLLDISGWTSTTRTSRRHLPALLNADRSLKPRWSGRWWWTRRRSGPASSRPTRTSSGRTATPSVW